MHRFALLAPILLGACAAAEPPMHGETPGRVCAADPGEQFIGKSGTSETGAAILRATHAAVLRWAPPGAMLTMDFRSDRVTVRLGRDGRITAIKCG